MSNIKPPYSLMRRFRQMCLFPISAGEKFPPCFDDNLRLASNDTEQVAKWSAMFPGCNWGLSLKKSRLIVVDIDIKAGKVGQDSLVTLELEHGPMPKTFTVRTPSGGLHRYYSETSAVKHAMRLNAFGKDIDSTNYVLAPGGVLVNGRYDIIDDSPIADAPPWFSEYLAPMIGDNSAADQVPVVEQDTPDLIAWAIHYLKYDAKPSIQFQNGEFTLLMVAAVLKDHGISQQRAVDLLAKYYNERCSPPWSIGDGPPEDRLDVKVENAWLYLKAVQPGGRTAEAAFADDPVDTAALNKTIAWWKDRQAVMDDGGPTPREIKLMLKKGMKP
jgi:hypothetical protein